MDLFEYQGKQYFARFGIPISKPGGGRHRGRSRGPGRGVGYPVVVKAQVKVGGRGKAGGVKLADNVDEVREHAGNILGLDIKGHVVKRLWVEHASDIAKEYYASFTLDRSAKKHLGMLSAEGGVEIEEVAVTNPDAIAMLHVDPVDGSPRGGPRAGWTGPTSTRRPASRAAELLVKLYTCYTSRATATWPRSTRSSSPRGQGARPRRQGHPGRQRRLPPPRVGGVRRQRRGGRAGDPGQGAGLNYIGLDGSVGIIANGAGWP
jgi:succinyl-CoA synthetase beta subunit